MYLVGMLLSLRSICKLKPCSWSAFLLRNDTSFYIKIQVQIIATLQKYNRFYGFRVMLFLVEYKAYYCNCICKICGENFMYIYRTGKYFSKAANMLAWVASIVGAVLLAKGVIIGLVLMPVALITQLTYFSVELHIEEQTYREGVMFLGKVFGKMQPLPGFDFLFLKKNNYRRLAESRASMATFSSVKFDGYIKLADNTRLHLLQESDKGKALKEMLQIADDLQIEFRDLTELK